MRYDFRGQAISNQYFTDMTKFCIIEACNEYDRFQLFDSVTTQDRTQLLECCPRVLELNCRFREMVRFDEIVSGSSQNKFLRVLIDSSRTNSGKRRFTFNK